MARTVILWLPHHKHCYGRWNSFLSSHFKQLFELVLYISELFLSLLTSSAILIVSYLCEVRYIKTTHVTFISYSLLICFKSWTYFLTVYSLYCRQLWNWGQLRNIILAREDGCSCALWEIHKGYESEGLTLL